MANLETQYMGLTLKNPLIVGSSSLTNSLSKIEELEENGAGAVVLKSIFEEQILMEASSLTHEFSAHPDEWSYIQEYTKEHSISAFLDLIEKAKKKVNIPIIASINCISPDKWIDFSKRLIDAGADALELNVFIIPSDIRQKSEDIEKVYFDLISAVRQRIEAPIAIKLSPYFSGLAGILFQLSTRGIDGLVLFNRFHQPDVDLERVTLTHANMFSCDHEISLPLRWIGLLAGQVKCDLAASTGIHSGTDMVKCLLVGAKAVQVASTIYRNGAGQIRVMLDQMGDWMKKHKFRNVSDFAGKLSQKRTGDPLLFERAQFMKYLNDTF